MPPDTALDTPAETFESIMARLAECDQQVVRKLNETYALMSVSVHRWRGNYKIQDAEVLVQGDNLTTNKKIASRPYWHLMPPEWETKFTAIDQQKEEILRAASVPSEGLHGVRVILASKLEECCNRLSALEEQLQLAAKVFTSEDTYKEIFQWLEKELATKPQALAQAKQRIPSRQALRQSFRMERLIIPTAMPEWALNGTDFHSRELQKSERKLMASNIAALVQKPLQELAESLAGFLDQLMVSTIDGIKLRPNRKITRPAVDALRRRCEEFETFEDVVDKQLFKNVMDTAADLRHLAEDMAIQASHRHRLPINTDENLAQAWLDRLNTLHQQITNEDTMVAGLRKLCRNSGVDVPL